LLIFAVSACPASKKVDDIIINEVKQEEKQIEINYANEEFLGVLIRFDYINNIGRNVVTYDLIEPERNQYYKDLIKSEMKRYPDGFFVKQNLKTISIVQNLDVAGKGRLGGTYIYDHNIIFININYMSDDYFIRALHHEIQHLVDYRYFDRYFIEWAQWRELFEASDKSTHSGFISDYARLNPKEDRAEVFGHYMGLERTKNNFLQKAKNDEIFYQKAILLFTFYKERVDFNLLDDFLLEMNH